MSRVIEITNSDESDNFIENNSRGIIFFGSVRCPHCRKMSPIYEQLANKYRSIGFAHVETSEVKVDNIDGVPVFVAYKDHVPVDIVVGANQEALIAMIQQKLLLPVVHP